MAAIRPATWLRADAVVHGRARAARANREALCEAGRGVCGTHREQLLRGTHVLVVLAGEGTGGQDLSSANDTRKMPTAAVADG